MVAWRSLLRALLAERRMLHECPDSESARGVFERLAYIAETGARVERRDDSHAIAWVGRLILPIPLRMMTITRCNGTIEVTDELYPIHTVFMYLFIVFIVVVEIVGISIAIEIFGECREGLISCVADNWHVPVLLVGFGLFAVPVAAFNQAVGLVSLGLWTRVQTFLRSVEHA